MHDIPAGWMGLRNFKKIVINETDYVEYNRTWFRAKNTQYIADLFFTYACQKSVAKDA